MKSAFRNAHLTLFRSLNPNPNPNPPFTTLLPLRLTLLIPSSPPSAGSRTFRSLSATLSCAAMAGGEAHAPPPLEKQFEDFRSQLEESATFRERIRGVVMEIESTTRLMHSSILLVHQSRSAPELLEKPKAQIGVLKELYNRLAEVVRESPGRYYRYHGDWRSETQTVVSLLAFMHWLETGTLLLHTEAEEKLGLDNSEFGLDVEDYLLGTQAKKKRGRDKIPFMVPLHSMDKHQQNTQTYDTKPEFK